MRGYSKESVKASHDALVARGFGRYTPPCPCEHGDYCKRALRTGELLACELSDASLGIPIDENPNVKARDGQHQDEYGDWYMTGTIRLLEAR